jgi:uncharacterized protein (DUF3084 family)
MALSRVKGKTEIGAFEILLEIAIMLEQLTSNPAALKKAAEDAYSLDDSEEQKAIIAKQDIAKNEQLLSDMRKQKIQLDIEVEELEKEKNGIKSTVDNLKKEQGRLSGVEQDLGKRALELENYNRELSAREKKVADDILSVESRTKELNDRQQAIVDGEITLKEKLDKLRGIVDA